MVISFYFSKNMSKTKRLFIKLYRKKYVGIKLQDTKLSRHRNIRVPSICFVEEWFYCPSKKTKNKTKFTLSEIFSGSEYYFYPINKHQLHFDEANSDTKLYPVWMLFCGKISHILWQNFNTINGKLFHKLLSLKV